MCTYLASQEVLVVKNLPANSGDNVRDADWSLGQEDHLEEKMVTHSSIFIGESHRQRSLAGNSPWSQS